MGTTRTIQNTGAGLVTPGGDPIVDCLVRFRLVERSGSQAATTGWLADTHEAVGGDVTAFTDDDGEFSLAVYPNDQLAPETWYAVRVDASANSDFWVQIPTGNGTALTLAEVYELAEGTLTPAAFTTLSDRIDAVEGGPSVTEARLKEWTEGGDYELATLTYDGTYSTVIASGVVVWPDGSAGTFTTDTINTSWLTIDAYHVTHADSNKTVTQAEVTRNSDGNVTVKPALEVA